jgi:hypothetical protein
MHKSVRLSAAAAVLSLALTGCAFAPVASPNGEGLCGTDPVSLSVSQDSVGNNIQIDYTGPSDVSLLLNRFSFYFDFEDYLESIAPGEFLELTVEDSEPAILKLDPTNIGWSESSADGGQVNWAFDGNIEQLMSDLPVDYEDSTLYLMGRAFPISIAVSCDASLTSTANYADSNTSDSNVDGLEIAVAQALYPRHSTIETVSITNYELVGGNLEIDFEFAEGTADRFHDFDLGGGYVMIAPLGEEGERPEIGNGTYDGAWFNFADSCWEIGPHPVFCDYDAPFGNWTFDGTNRWTIPGVDEMVEGEYLGVFFLTDSQDDPTDLRFAFNSFEYDSVNGFVMNDLDTQPRENDERLAATGGDPNVIIWAVLGGLVVLAAVVLRPKRRKV